MTPINIKILKRGSYYPFTKEINKYEKINIEQEDFDEIWKKVSLDFWFHGDQFMSWNFPDLQKFLFKFSDNIKDYHFDYVFRDIYFNEIMTWYDEPFYCNLFTDKKLCYILSCVSTEILKEAIEKTNSVKFRRICSSFLHEREVSSNHDFTKILLP